MDFFVDANILSGLLNVKSDLAARVEYCAEKVIFADMNNKKQGMDNFLELVRWRYSVRRYSSQPVEQEKLDYVLECARLAPSAVNFQPWRFVVVKSAERRAALCSCYKREWLAEAPLYIVVCADRTQSWKRGCDGHDHADIDAAIAAEHICLAAADCGLGTCWVCNFDVEKCTEALGLGEGICPVAIVPVGYAADSPTDKKRKPLSEVAYEL